MSPQLAAGDVAARDAISAWAATTTRGLGDYLGGTAYNSQAMPSGS